MCLVATSDSSTSSTTIRPEIWKRQGSSLRSILTLLTPDRESQIRLHQSADHFPPSSSLIRLERNRVFQQSGIPVSVKLVRTLLRRYLYLVKTFLPSSSLLFVFVGFVKDLSHWAPFKITHVRYDSYHSGQY